MTAVSFFIANRYKVITTLSGGMGIVHFCIDTEDNDFPVALKTFKKEFLSDLEIRSRFLREATVWSELGFHQNIVQAYKVLHVPDDNSVFIILQLIPSPPNFPDPSLRSRLVYGPPMTEEECLVIALGIIRGMKYAVNKIPGLIHRDLKPENILLGTDNQPRITDFGLVGIHNTNKNGVILDAYNPFENIFTDVYRGGTLLYMSPEQFSGQHIDYRTDIYALGCIIYEMIANEPAVIGRTEFEIYKAHLSGMALSRISRLNCRSSIKTLLQRCVNPNPVHRYSDWSEIEKMIEQILINEFNQTIVPDLDPIDVSIRREFQRAESMLAIGTSYINIGNYEYGIGFFENARLIAEKQGFPLIYALSIADQGVAFLQVGDFDHAISFLSAAIERFIELGENGQVCYHTGNLGNAYFGIYDLNQAEIYLERAVTMAENLEDPLNIARWRGNLGNVYLARGNLEKALKLFQGALDISKRTNDRASVGKHLASIAHVYEIKGNFRKTKEYYHLALQEAISVGDRQTEGMVYLSIGNLYIKRKKIDLGISYANKGLDIGREINDKLLVAKALGNIGNGCLVDNQSERAKPLLQEAIQISQEINALDVYARANLSLGFSYEMQYKFMSAIEHLTEAVRVFKILQMPEYVQASEHLRQLRKALNLR